MRAFVRACVWVASLTVCLCGLLCVGSICARTIESRRDRCCMCSIIRDGDTFHGISVVGRGVFRIKTVGTTYAGQHRDGFRNKPVGTTYAGQHRDGYACGLGVLTYSDGTKEYAEHGPDGNYDGRYLGRSAHGTTIYRLFERGKVKDFAYVFGYTVHSLYERGKLKERTYVRNDGRCMYNNVYCAPDDPRLLALIAQVTPVEVRPAAPAPRHPQSPAHSPGTRNRPMDRPARFAPAGAGDRRGHRGAHPRRTQPNSSRTAKHDHAVTRACAGST